MGLMGCVSFDESVVVRKRGGGVWVSRLLDSNPLALKWRHEQIKKKPQAHFPLPHSCWGLKWEKAVRLTLLLEGVESLG